MAVVGEAANILALVDFTLKLCCKIYTMAQNVKANKRRCQQVAQRFKALEELVLAVKKRGPRRISATVENALRELCDTLYAAKALMKKYSQANAFMSFMKSSSHEDKFYAVDKSLTDTFQVLSGALLIEQGDVLHKVYETVKGGKKSHARCRIPAPEPSTTPTVTTYSPVTAAPEPSTTPTVTTYSPVTAAPEPSTTPTVTTYSPVTAAPEPSTTPTVTTYSPVTAAPEPSTTPTVTVYSPTAPAPFCRIVSTSTSSISLRGTMTSVPFSAPNSTINILSPMTFSPPL